ncbi:MAG: aspartate-alanine antiporter [Natronosporangium sp.]
MLNWAKELLNETPELALFVCLALGFALGKVRIWKITLGGVAGSLIVAIFVGMWAEVSLNDQVKNIAFALFIFTLGFMAGPSFFASLNRRSLRYGVFTVVEVVTILIVVGAATVLLDLDQGTAAGLLAGGATESAVVGTATDAIGRLNLPDEQIATLQANVGTAYSISYICGLITIVLLTSQIFPRMMRINLRDEADKLWQKLGGGADQETSAPALPGLVGRAYQATTAVGRTVGQVESALQNGAAVEEVRRDGATLTFSTTTTIAPNDVVVLVGQRESLVGAGASIGPEVTAPEGDHLTLDVADVVLQNKQASGHTLGELRAQLPVGERHGVFLSGISRLDHPLPVRDDTQLNNGDVLKFSGLKRDLASFVPRVGFRIDPKVKADLIFIALGVLAGMLIGKLTLTLGDVPLSLGTGGGCLLTGLLFGWLRARRPTFGQYDPAAAQVIKDLGLAAFIVAVGLGSGPEAVALVEQYGAALPIAGVLVTLIPASVSLFVAWRLMKLPAPLALGSIAGQQCSTPAITAVQQAAGNTTPLMAYTIVYALSNVVLPLLGPIVVAMSGALN